MLLLLLLVPACDPAGMSACLDLCADSKLGEDDRATCRLNCQNSYRETPTPAFDPQVGQTTRCFGACYPAKGGAAEPVCVAACREGAGERISAEALETLETCVSTCQADAQLGEDDRATCRLQCAQSIGR
jgi:hypothetical protein